MTNPTSVLKCISPARKFLIIKYSDLEDKMFELFLNVEKRRQGQGKIAEELAAHAVVICHHPQKSDRYCNDYYYDFCKEFFLDHISNLDNTFSRRMAKNSTPYKNPERSCKISCIQSYIF